MIHPYWDMALLVVDGLAKDHPALRLSLEDPEAITGRRVAVIGYPAFDPRNDAEVQNRVFGGAYNVKRLQPGLLGRRFDIQSFGKSVSAATHDGSTLGGDSGAVVFDPQTGTALALHFGGVYLERNYAVAACDLAMDGRVIDAGVQFAGAARRQASSYWSLNSITAAYGIQLGRIAGAEGMPTEALIPPLVDRIWRKGSEFRGQLCRAFYQGLPWCRPMRDWMAHYQPEDLHLVSEEVARAAA